LYYCARTQISIGPDEDDDDEEETDLDIIRSTVHDDDMFVEEDNDVEDFSEGCDSSDAVRRRLDFSEA